MALERKKTRSNFKLNWSSFPSPAEGLVKPWWWTFAIRVAGLEGRLNRQKCCANSSGQFVVFVACVRLEKWN
jgi:hypothetical protein